MRTAVLLFLSLAWRGEAFAPPLAAPRSLRRSRCASAAADDVMCTALSADGYVSAKAVATTQLVRRVTLQQGCLPLASAALGRAMTSALLVAEGVEAEETFQVRFDGNGPLRGVFAVANGRLETRGYVGNPKVNLPLNDKGKLDVGGGVGAGPLMVVRAKQLPGDDSVSPYVEGDAASTVLVVVLELRPPSCCSCCCYYY